MTGRGPTGAGLELDAGAPQVSAREFLKRRHQRGGIRTLRRHLGTFYTYDHALGIYGERADTVIRSALYQFLGAAMQAARPKPVPFNPTKARVTNVLDALNGECEASEPPPCWLDDDGQRPDAHELLAFPNGILHAPSRVLIPPTPAFFTTNGLTFHYNADAPKPTHWLRFLHQLWPADIEARSTLQEFMGYLLVPRIDQRKMLMVVGPPSAGKGTIADVVSRLVGEANCCAPTLASLSTNFGLQNMIGKRVALIGDARLHGHNTTAVSERLLGISGGDRQSIARKYIIEWTGRLAVRFVVLTNELPTLHDQAGALASRFIILKLTESFLGREDHGLGARLAGELPGILNWSLDGLDRLTTRGYFEQPESGEPLVQQMGELGSPVSAFLHERCDVGGRYEAAQSAVFSAWRDWCERGGGGRFSDIRQLGKDLRSVVPGLDVTQPRDATTGKQVRHWTGLRLKPGAGAGSAAQFGGRVARFPRE